jgi:hypothetical protein
VSVLYIHVAYPSVSSTILAGGAGLLAWKAACIKAVLIAVFSIRIQTGLTAVLQITNIFITPSEDEEEKERCDSEDGYRRMDNDETVLLYVAVPLQVV